MTATRTIDGCRRTKIKFHLISQQSDGFPYTLMTDRKNSSKTVKLLAKLTLTPPPLLKQQETQKTNQNKKHEIHRACNVSLDVGKGKVQEKVVLEKEGLVSHRGGLWVVSCHGFGRTETPVRATGTAAGRAEDWSITDGHGGVSRPTEKRDVQLNLSSRRRWDPARTAW